MPAQMNWAAIPLSHPCSPSKNGVDNPWTFLIQGLMRPATFLPVNHIGMYTLEDSKKKLIYTHHRILQKHH
jgi:hypothetical protein